MGVGSQVSLSCSKFALSPGKRKRRRTRKFSLVASDGMIRGGGERPSSFASGKNFWLSWLKKPFYRFVRFSRARERYNDRTGSGGKTLVFDRLFHAFSKLLVCKVPENLNVS